MMMGGGLKSNVTEVLSHYYAKSVNGIPFAADSNEKGFSLNRGLTNGPLYKSINQRLERGESLYSAFSAEKGIPDQLLNILKKGEETGNVTTALGTILEMIPTYNVFRFHVYGIISYLLLTTAVFIVAIIYYSRSFTEVISYIPPYVTFEIPFIFKPLLLLSNSTFIGILILVAAVSLISIKFFYGQELLNILLRVMPMIKQNYFRLLSIEIATNCIHSMKMGFTTEKALQESVEGLQDKTICESFKSALASVSNGTSLSGALASQNVLSSLPVISALRLGDKSGKTLDLLKEQKAFLQEYLDNNLEDEMKQLFALSILTLGMILGAGIIYIFSSIFFTYYTLSL